MTTKKSRLFALLLATALLLSAIGCDKSPSEEDPIPPSVEDTSISSSNINGDDTEENPSDEIGARHETTDLPYFEESITLKLYESYEWNSFYTQTGELDTYGYDTDIIAILGASWIMGEQPYVNVAFQAMGIGETKIEVRIRDQVRVLRISVIEDSTLTEPDPVTPTDPVDPTDPTEPEDIELLMEDVAHLEANEVYEWCTPFVNTGEISLTQSDETAATVLGSSTMIDANGTVMLNVVIQASEITGYTAITVTCGGYTRILHLHVHGKEAPPPSAGASIFITVNDSNENLILGERESRVLIMVELSSDGTLTIESTDQDVLSYRYEYHPTVSEHGLVASLELFVTPISVGETTVRISYPEHPDAVLEIPFKVSEEDPIHLGERTLCESISVDKTDAEVYRDDTTVTYTVITSTDVDKLELIHLSNDYYLPVGTFAELTSLDDDWVFALDMLTVDSSSLSDKTIFLSETKTSYSASRKEENGKYIWTVSWDLGSTAVSFVQVNAIDTDKNVTDESYVKLNITYPEFNVSEGLRVVINRWVELNLTEPLIFTVDTDTLTDYQKYVFYDLGQPSMLFMDEVEMLMGNPTRRSVLQSDELSRLKNLSDKEFYDIIFNNNVIYRRTFADGLLRHAMVACMLGNSRHGHSYPQLEGKQILAHNQSKPIFFFHYSIYDETRALIAYENGYEIDEEKFPFAHDILEKGSAVIDEIIADGMTDFEKEKAIYDWMIQNYYKGVKAAPEIGDPQNPNPEWVACIKSAYGILNQYEADCMGWSGTFYLLCNMAGIPCSTFSCNADVKGGADENFKEANHRINVIRLDGEYYFVEVFWFYQKLDPNEGNYRFMNMTAERAAKEYSWPGTDIFSPNFSDYTTYLVDEHTGELLEP